ncbi:MAG: hypothetical protein LKG11_04895 [Bacilli bacterium]|jgi:hypothetical protein|nr:hypothetical protein [Bacilli bacterium]
MNVFEVVQLVFDCVLFLFLFFTFFVSLFYKGIKEAQKVLLDYYSGTENLDDLGFDRYEEIVFAGFSLGKTPRDIEREKDLFRSASDVVRKTYFAKVFRSSFVVIVAVADFYRDFRDPAGLVLADYSEVAGEEPDGLDVVQVRKGDRLFFFYADHRMGLCRASGEFVCSFPGRFYSWDYRRWSGFFKKDEEANKRFADLRITRVDVSLDSEKTNKGK